MSPVIFDQLGLLAVVSMKFFCIYISGGELSQGLSCFGVLLDFILQEFVRLDSGAHDVFILSVYGGEISK